MIDRSSHESEDHVEEWDGVPKLNFSRDEMMEVLSTVPQWHGIALGPPLPWGDGARAKLEVNVIFKPTREEAMDAMEWWMENACREERMVFDRDDWSVVHLALINAC